MVYHLTKEDFEKYYYSERLTMKQLAKKFGSSSGSICRDLKRLGLPAVKKELAWNSGKTCFNDTRILSGEKHPRWKNASKYYIDFKIKRKEIINGVTACEHCGKIAKLLHHKDKNTGNNEYSNLLPLCFSCHSILHNKERGVTTYKHNCEHCGKQFTVLSNRKCNQRCCSLKCKAKLSYNEGKTLPQNRKGKTYYVKNCEHCKKEFRTTRKSAMCCSYSCSMYHRWEKRR